jgi:IS30 family transposase
MRKAPRKYSDEERRLIEKRTKEGVSIRAIALELDRPKTSLAGEVERGGGAHNYDAESRIARASRRNKCSPISQDQKEQIAILFSKGYSRTFISRQVGTSPNTVSKWTNGIEDAGDRIDVLDAKIEALEQHIDIISASLERLLKGTR